MSDRQQFATFFLGDSYFGVEVERVQEILRNQEMTPVPLSSPVVRGLINLRGQIVTAIDLRCRLGLPVRSEVQPLMNVVVRSSGGGVSLLVDDIGDVVEGCAGSFELPPDTLPLNLRTMIVGVHKLDHLLMHVIDCAKVADLKSD
ncbi:MAG: chemotaxis protein CheW [Acidobacteriota bacterium]